MALPVEAQAPGFRGGKPAPVRIPHVVGQSGQRRQDENRFDLPSEDCRAEGHPGVQNGAWRSRSAPSGNATR